MRRFKYALAAAIIAAMMVFATPVKVDAFGGCNYYDYYMMLNVMNGGPVDSNTLDFVKTYLMENCTYNEYVGAQQWVFSHLEPCWFFCPPGHENFFQWEWSAWWDYLSMMAGGG